jgi:hypothetical protein
VYCKDAPVDQRVIFSVYDDSPSFFYVAPQVVGIRGGESGWNPDDYLAPKLAGENKLALHLSDTTASVICNGVVLGSGSISGGGGSWLDHTWATLQIDVNDYPSAVMSAAGLYGDITLEQAIALTA